MLFMYCNNVNKSLLEVSDAWNIWWRALFYQHYSPKIKFLYSKKWQWLN